MRERERERERGRGRDRDRDRDRETATKLERERELKRNKAGYTATEVACWWAGAIFEITRPFGQEQ